MNAKEGSEESPKFEIEIQEMSFSTAIEEGYDPHFIRQWARANGHSAAIAVSRRAELELASTPVADLVTAAMVVYEHSLLHVWESPLGLTYYPDDYCLSVYDQFCVDRDRREAEADRDEADKADEADRT